MCARENSNRDEENNVINDEENTKEL